MTHLWTPQRSGGRREGRDRGQVAIEYLGFLPLLLLIGLVGVQMGVIAYAAQQAGTGARAAARAASVDDPDAVPDPESAGRTAMSAWIAGRSDVSEEGGVATVTVRIPSLIPFWSFEPVERTATMPVPDPGSDSQSGSGPGSLSDSGADSLSGSVPEEVQP
ncbi:TadE/TadG family type IV pilus assembly protein [Streptomyces roseoviridis]|uniref:TadE/TadG family type IV pilus assembly protein n=1 Tax=Streptomyces roseoviridis TaxID=67361 RepID=A0ABV5QPU5_9ACTN